MKTLNKNNMLNIFLLLVFSIVVNCQNNFEIDHILPTSIESVKIQDNEIKKNFVLFVEDLYMPNKDGVAQIEKKWRRQNFESDLMLITEDEVQVKDSVLWASCIQKWYRFNKKEKIEINIIVIPSKNEISNTVETFTEKLYSVKYIKVDDPLVGDECWLAEDSEQFNGSYALMFLKANVFVRVYITLNDNTEMTEVAEEVARKIEGKIITKLNK